MLSRKDSRELQMIKDNLVVDTRLQRVTLKYPLVKDPSVVKDNRWQAVNITTGLEKKLLASLEKLDAYNLELKGFLDRGVLVELSAKEMEEWRS